MASEDPLIRIAEGINIRNREVHLPHIPEANVEFKELRDLQLPDWAIPLWTTHYPGRPVTALARCRPFLGQLQSLISVSIAHHAGITQGHRVRNRAGQFFFLQLH